MNKGIAIRTILYLLVGILVVAVVVYMVYTYVIGAPIDEQRCRSMAITWCTSCKNSQTDPAQDPWADAGISASSDLQDCASTHWGATISDCTTAKTFCSTFIPL